MVIFTTTAMWATGMAPSKMPIRTPGCNWISPASRLMRSGRTSRQVMLVWRASSSTIERDFERAARQWPHYLDITRRANHEGQFVSFPSFEWHSIRYGDHNVYVNGSDVQITEASDLTELRGHLRSWAGQGVAAFLIPHHIGYHTGHRGISWADFDGEFSPVVEIFSMHGLSEGPQGPYSYLHTMGPVDERSSVQYGLQTGRVFGFIGSTDHHSAHPGSYGSGRVAVWADDLSRRAVWEAIAHRRTYALTGDRISLAFSLNEQPMGSMLPAVPTRWIEVETCGGGAIDYVEVLHNNCIIERWNLFGQKTDQPFAAPVKILLELGWGEKGVNVDWQGHLSVNGGQLLSVEPRFRGHDILEPQAAERQGYAFSSWRRAGTSELEFETRTWGNPATTTSGTQGICLEIDGDARTQFSGHINGQFFEVCLGDLEHGARTFYLGGFLTPAFCVHGLVSQSEYRHRAAFSHRSTRNGRDWYYVRVRQHNGQWAWSSPIWVG